MADPAAAHARRGPRQGGSEDLVERAREVAVRAHAGQLDKVGEDYVAAHVADVARRLGGAPAEVVAVGWLHDVLEDTAVTEAELREGFPAEVVDAVRAISRVPGEPGDGYYARVRADALALRVKLADIASNTDPARTARLEPATRERLARKYEHALAVLTAP